MYLQCNAFAATRRPPSNSNRVHRLESARIEMLLCLAVLALAFTAVQGTPLSRAVQPGHVYGTWDIIQRDSSEKCPAVIRHIAYRTTKDPAVFVIKHDDIFHNNVECGGGPRMIFVRGDAILDPTLLSDRTSRSVLEKLDKYIHQDASYMATAKKLQVAKVAFYGILELNNRYCGGVTSFEEGAKGFLVAEAKVSVKIPPFSAALPAGMKYMALFEGGTGGRRCLYSAAIDSGPLRKPINAVSQVSPSVQPKPAATSPSASPAASPSVSEAPKEDPTAVPEPEKKTPAASPKASSQGEPTGSGSVFDKASKNSTINEGNPTCFPGSAMVQLSDGTFVPMRQLKIGDTVRVAPSFHSKVFMFTHKLSNGLYPFVRINTVGGQSIELSPGHFLYINGALSPASTARRGDMLTLANGTPASVTEVSRRFAQGLYNPQTLHGDISVNNVLCSTYTTGVERVIAHSALAPLRLFYRVFGVFTTALETGRYGPPTLVQTTKY